MTDQTTTTLTTSLLLVEDNPGDAFLIREMLSEVNHSCFDVTCVDRISAALDELTDHPVDVLLLDLSLPDSQGLETLPTIIAHVPTLPIVVLTGYDDETIGIRAVQQGAQDYLVKGQVNGSMLARAVRYAIERKRSEEKLKQVALSLEQNNRELHHLYEKVSALEQLKSDMIRIAAHDLRGIVALMNGYLDMLRPDMVELLSSEQLDFFHEIEKASDRMRRLTDDILSLERIEASASGPTNTVDLSLLVAEAYEHNRAQAELRGHHYAIDVPQAPLMVNGEITQLREAVTNLINNALKYTPDGGTVEVRLHQQDRFAVFEVQDSGYGVPDDKLSRLFQPFYRAKSKETERIEGTGLGLYLVKNVIQRHGGEMLVHSVYRQGSTFGFRLPLAHSH